MPYTKTNYDELYNNIGNARKMALDAALLGQQQSLAGQQNALAGQYNDVRSQAYTGNRVSALGNNERMAAMGLAGNAYAGPQSGYSETSRIAQDTSLQNSLNAATRQQQAASDALTQQGFAAQLNRDQQLGSALAELDAQKISANTAQDQFAATYNFNEAQAAQQQKNWQATFDRAGKSGAAPHQMTDEELAIEMAKRKATAQAKVTKDYRAAQNSKTVRANQAAVHATRYGSL